jgi:hypothetical protein
MTNLEALRHSVAIPVAEKSLELILINRGINRDYFYEGESREFELARADVLKHCVTQPNVSEGGYSLSVSEKKELARMAAELYDKHGESHTLTPQVRNASNRW